MLPFRSDIVKVVSLTALLIAVVLITIILAESPNLRDVDLKLLPNNSSKLVPKPSREEPAPAAQQPNPNYLGGNGLGNLNGNQLPQNVPPNYPSLIGMLAPALLPGLNSAEQQLSPYQLSNASPGQLQRLRQMQEMQQLQRQQGAGPLTNLIGAFLPGGGQLLGGNGGLNQANGRPNNNLQSGQVGNQNPATLAQLLGLTPQQPLNNPYNQVSQLNNNGLQRGNVYGQPNRNVRPNANLRRANPESDDSNDGNSADNNSADNSGEENGGGDNGNEDNSGDSEEGNDQSNQPQQDPSQDPDIQQFNNLNGNDGNFPGDLFPAGILSENDLKDIQKSMEEQAKKEAEKQKQQEAGNGEAEDSGNAEDGGEGSDQTNSDDQSDTTDQSADDQSANQEEDANQTESPQNEANSELKDKSEQGTKAADDAPNNNGKLNVGLSVAPKISSGQTGNPVLPNKKPPMTNSYSYNSLRPNGIGNGNSNVQYEDDRSSLNNNRQTYRPKNYVSNSNANLPANRNYNGLRRGQQDGPYRAPGSGYGRDRFPNDFRPSTRFKDLPAGGNPFNSYGSTVDYSPEYNQDPSGGGLYSPGADYNPMSNYRPNELLNNHVSRQHGDINNFDYNGLRPRTGNPFNAGRTLDRNGLGAGLGTGLGTGLANDRSAVSYEPE